MRLEIRVLVVRDQSSGSWESGIGVKDPESLGPRLGFWASGTGLKGPMSPKPGLGVLGGWSLRAGIRFWESALWVRVLKVRDQG